MTAPARKLCRGFCRLTLYALSAVVAAIGWPFVAVGSSLYGIANWLQDQGDAAR